MIPLYPAELSPSYPRNLSDSHLSSFEDFFLFYNISRISNLILWPGTLLQNMSLQRLISLALTGKLYSGGREILF